MLARLRRIVVLLALLVLSPEMLSRGVMAGQLNDIRQEVRTPPVELSHEGNAGAHGGNEHSGSCPGDHHDPCGDGHSCCDVDEGCGWGEVLGPVIVWGVTSPFWAPVAALGDTYTHSASFLRYPYRDDLAGYLMIPRIDDQPKREWAGQLSGDFGSDLDQLTRIHVRGLLETGPTRLGVDAQASYLNEVLGLNTDCLWYGDFNLVFRFAQSENMAMRAGVGVNWLADRRDDDYGINVTYGGDWFPANPLVVSSHLDFGSVGHATLFHAQATVGVVWHGLETYLGYDHLSINSVGVDLLIGGIRVWF